MADQMIITPGGARHPSLVHRIEAGHTIDGTAGRLRQFSASQELVADFGPLAARPQNQSLMPANVVRPVPTVPGLQTGWISFAQWFNSTGKPITLFRSTWVVPPPPSADDGQLIYLFNGIQNSTMIYQPVLQWGSNGAFGGSYWVVASWYADGQGGQSFHSAEVRVQPGDTLVGVMTLTGQASGKFNYNREFQGIANTGLPISNQEELKDAVITLEAYNLIKCSDYPNADFTAFKSNTIQTTGAAPVAWVASNPVTDCGQHTIVDTVHNEVDIFYTRFPTNLFKPLYHQGDPGNGIGGYDLKSPADQAFAFDYNGSGKLDHLALYRPATGTIWILKNSNGTFSPVYRQGDPGNGIGGYDLKSPADRAFAFDYDSSGKLDHLALYRPATATIWILKNSNGTFSAVYHQGDPGNGIGGYDLKSSADRAFAFDYDGSGKLDHLALYRPATGTIWILKNSNGNFSPVYHQGDPGNGIGGYDLKSPADRAFAFDYNSSGKLDHLALYRPGTGTIWILRNSNGNFSPVYHQGDPGNGIGGYDLKSPADQVFAYDFDGSGKLDHLALYRPGTGTFWILKNSNGSFGAVYAQGDPGRGIDGYDLRSQADRAFAFDYHSNGKQNCIALYRPGTGTMWLLERS
ncbi:hypothetical protein [Bradyrhizobium sp. AZCC 2289]|uniref:hypothetical protein n=1 Tax=Bradyrhizobium sp. AZCC 2289 TaxID=3117026 RepID=UPI002FEFC127